MRSRGQLDTDQIPRANRARNENSSHDACAALDLAAGQTLRNRRLKTSLKAVDQGAGCAQTSKLNDRFGAEMEPGCERQRKEVQAGGCDVLSEFAGFEVKLRSEFGKQLGLQQMELGVVWSGRVLTDVVTMLHGRAGVDIALDAISGEQAYLGLRLFRKTVGRA